MDFFLRKNDFPHIFIHKGGVKKKSERVEHGHCKLEIAMKIKTIAESGSISKNILEKRGYFISLFLKLFDFFLVSL